MLTSVGRLLKVVCHASAGQASNWLRTSRTADVCTVPFQHLSKIQLTTRLKMLLSVIILQGIGWCGSRSRSSYDNTAVGPGDLDVT